MTEPVRVAVGVIGNGRGEVLIAKRSQWAHQGGLWEFPGGKIERGETVAVALKRELSEELGIVIDQCRPLICISHQYSDKSVVLHVLEVLGFQGKAVGNEGQCIQWVALSALRQYDFPAANVPIVAAARLPDHMMITGGATSEADFLQRVTLALEKGVKLIQLRAPELSDVAFKVLFQQVELLCRAAGAILIANTSVEVFLTLQGAAGLHLNAKRLKRLKERPIPEQFWLSASCHNDTELDAAARVGADFATLSAVNTTSTHPDQSPMGIEQFGRWVEPAKLPVYGLGGLSADDIARVRRYGGQGVAAINAFWPSGRSD